MKKILQKYGLLLAFFVASAATAGSLYYSEIANFPPCKLCWWQRIFMFPQVIILGISLIKKDQSIKKYIIILSLAGFLVALYQYLLPYLPTTSGCSAEIISCAKQYVNYFGFVTIPFLSALAFLLILLLASFQKEEK